jgi:hypothetical protein
MAKSFLEYFKTLLPNFSFDNSLLIKEYKKALTLLNPNEQLSLTNWLAQNGLKLQPIKIK